MSLLSAGCEDTHTHTHTHTADHVALSVLCQPSVDQTVLLLCFPSPAHVRLSDKPALIYDSCKQTQPADITAHAASTSMCLCVCVCFMLTWLIILSVSSVAFLKCNLTEQHERCETPEKTLALPGPRLVLRQLSLSLCILACVVLAYLCSGMLGNWIPPFFL